MTEPTIDDLARTMRALDHAANTAATAEVRLVMRTHHIMGALLLGVLEDPSRLPVAVNDWDQLCRSIVRSAVESDLVNMGAHYAAERHH